MRFSSWLSHPMALFVVLLLSGCGGGGGGGGSTSTDGGGSTPPPTIPGVASYTISVTVSGLVGTALVLNNLYEDLTVNGNGSFAFPTAVHSGFPYSVSIKSQPGSPAQVCSVANGSGDITGQVDVQVVCKNTIGGTVSGVVGTIVVQDNGTDNYSISADGAFAFPVAVTTGTAYNVTVLSSTTAQRCTVTNGTGIAEGNVTSIQILCKNTIGGIVSGLSGTVILQNNGTDNLSISNNGSFTFATAIATSSNYKVTVYAQPVGQTCLVTPHELGTANGSVTNIQVNCVDGQWTWMSGPSTSNQSGVYGTKGVAADGNRPGARHYAVSWTDSVGNLWLFGGHGYGAGTSFGVLNDLWKFIPGTNQWVWVGGSDTADAVGVYGTKGTAASTNMPGARQSALSWTDSSGNLWLFGGYGKDSSYPTRLNDLWKYNISSNQWTWMSGTDFGEQLGVYGTKGVPAASNIPGSRERAVGWFDATNNVLWMFGGYGVTTTAYIGDLNDLWKYDIGSGQWTWVSGANTRDQSGVYGTKGVAAAANVPGARQFATSWTDAAGNLWLFGGSGSDSVGAKVPLNDLWKFDGTLWAWVSGSKAFDYDGEPGVYGTLGVPAADNVPGSRTAAIGWRDSNGNLWLFGGSANNDLWKFDGSNWTWMNGGRPGSYGTIGVSGTGMPLSRGYMVPWIDAADNLWLFGGWNIDTQRLGDLWRYSP